VWRDASSLDVSAAVAHTT